MTPVDDREELIEQVYFFRTFRERLADNLPAQELLERIHEEILATTRLPMAIQFLATEMKHTGSLAGGFTRLGHYFTPFQAFAVRQAEEDRTRFTMANALLLLEREAQYRADGPTKPGLFVYQFEACARNRLGYEDGLIAMRGDPFYDADWKIYLDQVRRRIGSVDFADLIYVRSELYVTEELRHDPGYVSPLPPLFGQKEGKIARANHGRDPLYLFAALQRQLGYPEVPRPRVRDDTETKLDGMTVKFREMEARLRLLEGEMRGQLDQQLFGKLDVPPI